MRSRGRCRHAQDFSGDVRRGGGTPRHLPHRVAKSARLRGPLPRLAIHSQQQTQVERGEVEMQNAKLKVKYSVIARLGTSRGNLPYIGF